MSTATEAVRRGRRRPHRPFRRIRLILERVRLARRLREWSGVVDVPHELGERASELVARLTRRQRALERLMH